MRMTDHTRQGGFWGLFALCIAGICLQGMLANPAFAAIATIDQKAIHHAYNEGDFDAVIKLTNPFTNGNQTFSRADSLFVFKHLAVVYTANPATREKGKFFMYRMLEMLPSAELVEMYVSDDVDRIFDKVRKEFMMRQKNFGVDTTQIHLPEKQPASRVAAGSTESSSTASESPSARSKSKGVDPVWYWVAGGAVIAGVSIATVMLMQPDEAEGKTYVITGE